jgi:predicted N-acetyltransferase YhbS
MRIRLLQREDCDAVLGTWNAAASYDPLTPALLQEKTWDDPDFEPRLALVAEDGGRITGLGVGVQRDGRRGFVKLLAVAPDCQRRGIGTRLLSALEIGLGDTGATTVRVLESAPNYVAPGVDTRYEAALGFFEAAGYARVGEACNLAVDLAALGDCVDEPSSGFFVRRAAPGDRAALHSFLRRHWPSWRAETDRALANTPSTLHVALRGETVVGFAAFDANNLGTGWFGPMGVAPAERGTGLGRMLLRRCLDDMRAQGHDAATIAWVDNAGFYEHCAGAVPSRRFIRLEKKISQ